jgi:hypothetical protein
LAGTTLPRAHVDESFDFDGVAKNGTLFQPDAEDYFMVSRTSFDW